MAREPVKLYSRYLPKTLRQAFYAASHDPDIVSLRDEVSLLRTILSQALEKWGDFIESASPEAIANVSNLVKNIRETVVSLGMIEGKMRCYVHVSIFPSIINNMVAVIRGEVKDERILARISERLGKVSVSGGGGGATAVPQLEVGEETISEPVLVRSRGSRKH